MTVAVRFFLRRKIEDLGVQVHTEKANSWDSRRWECSLPYELRRRHPSWNRYDRVLRVFALKMPYSQLHIAIGERGGIVINDHCQTNIDNRLRDWWMCALGQQDLSA